jgi:hypothetical protein
MPGGGGMSDATAYRLRLHASGYQPIPCRGKNPGIEKGWSWQTLGNADPEEIIRWGRDYPDARKLLKRSPVNCPSSSRHPASM